MYSMHCKKCKTTEGYLTVASTRIRKDGSRYKQYICRSCNAKKKRIEIQRNGAAQRRADKASRAKYPEKLKARILARKHIPLQPCEMCGEKGQRHHEDYSKPLEVRFLCAFHHKQLHVGVL
jgi:hypothetical protein